MTDAVGLAAWLERDPVYNEACSIYCLDTEQLVCPSALLNTDNYASRNFKSVMADFDDNQRRVLRRMFVAKAKAQEVAGYVHEMEELRK